MTWILVADDDTPTRDTIRFVLEDAGYQVLEARDGREALTALNHTSRPLVALIDLLMPCMDGVALLRTVVTDAQLASRHRYIGMTAAVGPVTPLAESLLTQLHSSLLLKPFDMDTLLTAVERARASLSVRTARRKASKPLSPTQE